jgi:hypothetical protein
MNWNNNRFLPLLWQFLLIPYRTNNLCISEHLKGKINELETNKNKNIRDLYSGIKEFKEGYQPRINIIKDENGNLIADPQSVWNRWKIFFNQVINMYGIHDVRQMDIHTAEPLVPEPSLVVLEIATGKLKRCKSPGTDQIPDELVKAGGETLCSEIHYTTELSRLLTNTIRVWETFLALWKLHRKSYFPVR